MSWEEAIRAVLFSSEGDNIVSASQDKTIKIWPTIDDIDFEYHNTFIKNIKDSHIEDIREFQLPSFFTKHKNDRGFYDYPRINHNLTPLHVLCYEKDLDNLKKLLDILIYNKIFIPPFRDSYDKTVFDIAGENKFMLTLLLAYYSNKNIKTRISDKLTAEYTIALPNFVKNKIEGLGKFMDQQLENAVVYNLKSEDISQDLITSEFPDEVII